MDILFPEQFEHKGYSLKNSHFKDSSAKLFSLIADIVFLGVEMTTDVFLSLRHTWHEKVGI